MVDWAGTRAGGDDEILPLLGAFSHFEQAGDGLSSDELERLGSVLLDVFRKIPTSKAFMDVLVPSKITKLFDSRFDVVPSDSFALVDRI